MPGGLIFKLADSPSEFEQIQRLNYRTFAEEIGQYTPDGSGVLVDRFHARNLYHIAVQNGRVLGVVSVQDQAPFSIESRLPNPAVLASLGGDLLEVRLLALHPDCRHGLILPRLLWELYKHAKRHGYSHLIISAITNRLEMYERLGFRTLGPAVEYGAASFMPMALPLANPPERLSRLAALYSERKSSSNQAGPCARRPISLMPGPVEIAEDVRQAFQRPPVSHRSSEFIATYERVRDVLCRLSGQMHTAILTGSGTTANDAVALHLRAAFQDAPGLVLVNGEFGDRLVRQASRAGLQFHTLSWPWGQPWDLDRIAAFLDRGPAWLWAVHLETSTGVLNRLSELASLAAARAIPLAADCISSIGVTKLPSDGIWMSTGVSGKAIGAYAGLSFVFASTDALERTAGHAFPDSLDVRAAAMQRGPRFTTASSLVFALETALAHYTTEAGANRCFAQHERAGREVRSGLRKFGIEPIASDYDAAPCVTSFAVPHGRFLERCSEAGFELGGYSDYLRNRGWAQLATMGSVGATGRASEVVNRLFEALAS